ncbi:MAG: head GIN domain-containing protein [Bacteroidota bacterium]
MKIQNLFSILTLTFLTLTIFSCELDEICEKGDGATVSRTLELDAFHSIVIDNAANVFLSQGDRQKVVVEAQDNIIDLLDLDIDNETWTIDFTRNCVRDFKDLNIYITLPDIQRLTIDGSGNLVGETVFVVDDLSLVIDGSGDMDIAAEVEELNTRIQGSGDVKLEGFANIARFFVRGSGDISAFNLEAKDVDVEIRGSGDVEVFATDFLKVDIDGSGDVFYKGEPEITLRVDGSGELRNAN